MNKNNFFMVCGIVTSLGTHLELYSSEKNNETPYIIGADGLKEKKEQRKAEDQPCVTKITKEKTLPSHFMDDYAGEHRK